MSLNGSQLGFAGCQEEDLCQMHYVPERVSGLDDVVVVKIAAGPTHSLVLTSTAAVRQPVCRVCRVCRVSCVVLFGSVDSVTR